MTELVSASSSPHRIAPGPKSRPLIGNLPEARNEPLGFFVRIAREYGDVVRLKMVQHVHLLNHPDHVKHVLQDNHVNYEKGFGYDRLEPIVGKGLLTSEGDFWKRQRRLAQPAFHKQRIAAFAELMLRHTERTLQRWKGFNGSFDAHAELMRLTLAIVGDALFSVDLSGHAEATAKALATALEIINDRFNQLFVTPKAIPTPENRKLYSATRTLERMIGDIISERRTNPVDHGDLLSMFMSTQDADTGEKMTDRQLRDEVMTMVLAGHETTANALSWAVYLLSKHPDVERRLHQEIARVLEGRAPTLADLPKLEFTTWVLHETMRLYPPAWFIARKATKDDEIGGFHIPGGSTVFLLPYVAHRDARFWENAEGFDPDRFSAERSASRPRFAYFPFAAGPRMCIGNTFAMMEMQLILARVFQLCRLELVSGIPIEPEPSVTLRPTPGIPVTLRWR